MQKLQHSLPVNKLRVRLVKKLDSLTDAAASAQGAIASFPSLRKAVAALPLTTEEFGLAVNRLENAQRYYELGETGAARFELKLLKESLRSPDP